LLFIQNIKTYQHFVVKPNGIPVHACSKYPFICICKELQNKIFDANASYEGEFYFQIILYLGGYGLSYQMLVTRLKRLANFGGLISITVRQFHPVC
jgi:hypothetical protein